MKTNSLEQKTELIIPFLEQVKKYKSLFGFALILASQHTHAQFSNTGVVKVNNGTILSVHMDYNNNATGNFVNDGQVHVFENWKNDGTVTYTPEQNGKTHFTGAEEQIIEGSKTSDFKNVLFNNLASLVPFHLAGIISVADIAEFKKGILLADPYGGKMIFKENGNQTTATDLSFVDGEVEKQGKAMFEFPVGAETYFRPSYHAAGIDKGNVYTTQYFHKNSDDLHTHSKKDETIQVINNKEYWKVTQDKGSEKIILSLTMDNRTTPLEFFSPDSDTQLAIVRWDDALGRWVNEGGEVSEPSGKKPYETLLTSQVSGYGIFTMALVKKAAPEPAELEIFNAVSPNGDGLNDTFLIKGIDKYPDNTVEIYNRWGVKVFETKSYNESTNMFRGYSDGRATVNRNEKLPTGTYFYILKYNNGKKVVEKASYLYINNQ